LNAPQADRFAEDLTAAFTKHRGFDSSLVNARITPRGLTPIVNASQRKQPCPISPK
jgi:hypothetical protein